MFDAGTSHQREPNTFNGMMQLLWKLLRLSGAAFAPKRKAALSFSRPLADRRVKA